ncbi:1,2-phenylacetyl-CoA epoxidase subunit PaaC [Nocardioides pacificus]
MDDVEVAGRQPVADSVYDGLVAGAPGHVDSPADSSLADSSLADSAHWAFGTGFSDPLDGVDTTVPDGVDPGDLATYALMLGDDALVHAHRLSQWCSRAPDLEEDVALANIALDLLGQARLLLSRACAAAPGIVPDLAPGLPAASPVPAEDALAFFRDPSAFRNVQLAEAPNGDFAATVVRLVVLSTWRLALLQRLRASADPVLAAVAAKGVHEVAYHRGYAARWCVTLALGTDESRRRLLDAVAEVWPALGELLTTHPVEARVAAAGVGVDPADLAEEVHAVLDEVLRAAEVERPATGERVGAGGRRGRDGAHTEALGLMLAEMQSVARAHPRGRW